MPAVEKPEDRTGPSHTAIWVATLGVLFSSAVAFWVWGRGESQAEAALATRGEFLADSVASGVGSVVQKLVAVGGLYQASEEVTRTEFRVFITNFGMVPGVGGIAYAPVVTPSELEEYVRSAKDANPDYEVFEFDASSNRIPVTNRPIYLPIERSEPDTLLGQPYGFDMGSDPLLSAAIGEALEGRAVSATEFVTRPFGDRDEWFVLFFPVTDPETGEAFGMAMAVIDLGDFLEAHIPAVMRRNVEWKIIDVTDGTAAAMGQGRAWSTTVEVASRRWLLTVSGGDQFLGSAPLATLLVLLAGVSASLLAAYGVHQYRQKAQARGELERLRELARAKDQFLASVSHELRTPLTGVVGYAELLRQDDGLVSDGEKMMMVDSIADEAADLAAIIDDLLVAARSELDLLTVTRETASVRALVVDVLRAFGSATFDAVRVGEGPDEEWMVVGDTARIRQILRNLVSNARRYGGSEIEARFGKEDGVVTITLADNGPGLPEEEWERIFEPYHRVHEAVGQPAALGIGLSVSRHLAGLMGGNLAYRHVDGWSVFELTLPVGTLDRVASVAGRTSPV